MLKHERLHFHNKIKMLDKIRNNNKSEQDSTTYSVPNRNCQEPSRISINTCNFIIFNWILNMNTESWASFHSQLSKQIKQNSVITKPRKIKHKNKQISFKVHSESYYSTYHIWCTRQQEDIVRVYYWRCINFHLNSLTLYYMSRILHSTDLV